MKKLLIFGAVALSIFFTNCSKEETKATNTTSVGLTVEEKNMTMINKFTGTNCYYCGDWGWTLMEDLITSHKSDAVVVGTYSQNSFAKLFVSSIATDWDLRLPVTEGYPTFAPNFVDSWLYPVKDDLEGNITKTIDAFNATPVIVNSAYSVKISGDKAVVNVSTKFFKEASGEYQLGVYVMENGVIGNQSGPNGGANAAHHNVLRGGNSSWGEALASGTIAANTKIEKEVTLTLNSTWNVANLSFFTVIWKKNGAKWDFVNAHK